MNVSLENRALLWALLSALISLGGALLVARPIQMIASTAPPDAGSASEIAASPQLAAQGAGFFDQTCADCHGDDAHGDEGPDLHNLAIGNAQITHTIKNGVKGEMPSFAKKYDDRQIAAIAAYLRTLK